MHPIGSTIADLTHTNPRDDPSTAAKLLLDLKRAIHDTQRTQTRRDHGIVVLQRQHEQLGLVTPQRAAGQHDSTKSDHGHIIEA